MNLLRAKALTGAMLHMAKQERICECGAPAKHYARRVNKWFCSFCWMIIVSEESKRHPHPEDQPYVTGVK